MSATIWDCRDAMMSTGGEELRQPGRDGVDGRWDHL